MSGCECNPGAERKRDSAQPQGRAQPVVVGYFEVCQCREGQYADIDRLRVSFLAIVIGERFGPS